MEAKIADKENVIEDRKESDVTIIKLKDYDGAEPKKKDFRLARNPGQSATGGYHRVPSHGTISTCTTSTSLVTDYDTQNQKNFNLEFPVEEEDYSNSPDEEEDFETTRLHFQKHKQISIDSIRKPKMEMTVRNNNKDENLRTAVPFVKELSMENVKGKDFSINGDGSIYKGTTQKINCISQLFAALAVSLGSMVVGFTTAYTSPALVTMKETIQITDNQGSWISGLMPLAALLGGLSGGWLIDRVGRRNTILSTAIPFIASWIVIAQAPNVYVIYMGRALGGLCVGIGSLAFPVYLGEILQPELRGQLGLLPTALGNIGILVCYVAGKYLDWTNLAYLGATLPIAFLLLVILIPETPRWYVSRKDHKGARVALQWLRGKNANVDTELDDIIKSHQESETNETSVFDLFKREYLPAVAISIGLMFFQQFSGINAVIFYTVSIFKSAGSTIEENLCTIIVGIVNFGSTFVSTFLIDRLGRKKLLYISSVAMILTLATLGAFFYVQSMKIDVTEYGWLPLVSFVVYVIGFSLGFGPIPWLMMGEILPAKIRGSAASLVTAFSWTCTFIVTTTYANLTILIGTYGTFWLFGAVCVVGLFFTIFYVPETRGKSLEEIEKKLSGKR